MGRKGNKKSSTVRKGFYKRLIYLGIAIILMVFLTEQKAAPVSIGIAVLFFGLYQLLIIIINSPDIVDDFFPAKTYNEASPDPFDQFMYRFSAFLIIAGIVFVVFENKGIENTVDGSMFFWTYAIIGVLIATIVTIILKRRNPSVYYESKRRFTVHVGLFLGLFLIVPSIASFINQYACYSEVACKEYTIAEKATGAKNSSWLFIEINGQKERFEVSRTFLNSVKEGEQVTLFIQKGRLGYDFVKEFKTIDK